MYQEVACFTNQEIRETRSDDIIVANLSFEEWDKKDSAMKNYIYSSLTSGYLKHLVGKNNVVEY